MNKNELRGYIVDGILFVVFTVIAFAVPFKRTDIFGISYLFGVIAIAFQIYVFKVSFKVGTNAKSKFYGFPIARVGVTYLAAQLIASLVEMCLANYLPRWVVIIINILILAYALVGCIAADLMRDEIEKQDVNIKKDVNNMRALQSMTASFVGLCQDEETKKCLQDLADNFKYSDPVTAEDTKEMEAELKFMANEIQRALIDGDMNVVNSFCKRMQAGLAERNRVCKLAK